MLTQVAYSLLALVTELVLVKSSVIQGSKQRNGPTYLRKNFLSGDTSLPLLG